MQYEQHPLLASINTTKGTVDKQIDRISELENKLSSVTQTTLLDLLQIRIQAMIVRENMQELCQRAASHHQQGRSTLARNVYAHIVDLYENERLKRGKQYQYSQQDLPLVCALETLAEYLSELQQYQEATTYYQQGLEICRNIYEQDIEFSFFTYYDLANSAMEQRNYFLAEQHYQKALEEAWEHSPTNHFLVTRALEEMAYFYIRSCRDLAQAEKLLTEAVLMRRTQLGDRHPLTVASLNVLAIVYLQQNRVELAESIRRSTHSVFESLAQLIVLDTDALEGSMREITDLETQLRLAQESLTRFLAIHEKTLQNARNILDMYKKMLGVPLSLKNQLSIVESLVSNSEVESPSLEPRSERGKLSKEEHHTEWEEEEEDEKHVVIPGPESITRIRNLLYIQQHCEEAEELARRTLPALEERYGEQDLLVVSALNALARACQSQQKYAEALQHYRRSLQLCETMYGAENIHATATLSMLASCLAEMGEYVEAEETCLRLLGLYTWQKRSDSSLPLLTLAQICEKQARYIEAEQYYRRLLHAQEQKWGKETVILAEPLSGLMRICLRLRKLAEAEHFYQRALTIAAAYPTPVPGNSIRKWENDLRRDYANLSREMEGESEA